jgi:acetyl-CoA acetyltransferase
MSRRSGAAIVGVGTSKYFRRGKSLPATKLELAGAAILDALDDAGLDIADVDGLALFAGGLDVPQLAQTLGIPRIRFSALVAGSGGGCAGSVGLAEMAVASGTAKVVLCVFAVQQTVRYGTAFSNEQGAMFGPGSDDQPERDFLSNGGLSSPGEMFALIARRHMYQFGTTREAFGEVAVACRTHAVTRPHAQQKSPLTMEQYLAAPLIADPFCLYDYCLESDGAVCIVVAGAERADDLRHPGVNIAAAAQGGEGEWGRAMEWLGMGENIFASAGMSGLADELYVRAGLEPADVDVALLYDHFTGMVICQLEDFGFCPRGEGGGFVSGGTLQWPDGSLPLNTHGGNLSEAYMKGMSHIKEAVEQLRGTAVNQVAGAEVALVTSGPSSLPNSALLLTT